MNKRTLAVTRNNLPKELHSSHSMISPGLLASTTKKFWVTLNLSSCRYYSSGIFSRMHLSGSMSFLSQSGPYSHNDLVRSLHKLDLLEGISVGLM